MKNMRKILLVLLIGSMLQACNTASDKGNSAGKSTVEDKHNHTGESSELTLNNGVKWKSDSITTHNVIQLKTTADMFRVQPFPSINNYQLLGKDLSNGVNTLIQQCSMKGAEHESLHKWLEPILDLTNQLKNVTDTSKARQIFKSVDSRIDDYQNFFE